MQTTLASLDVDSSTGPDLLPTRILKLCAPALALPVSWLARRILTTGRWPETWCRHWSLPLFKKGSPTSPGNYRGIHLTAQISKVCERVLAPLFIPHLEASLSFGVRQFAYSKGKGCRDALLLMTTAWPSYLSMGQTSGPLLL